MSEWDEINSLVREYAKGSRNVIEQVCERMLTSPTGWGVEVIHEFANNKAWMTARLSPDVPFGQIHERTIGSLR